ncbi:hypothetical protein PTSG_01948 [Salpingoeca rosetta]|uniref:Choline transporter-like protein n=1 Tax=Salpingoeca rosetta (strain ATCC 50818 / BSB-021) TaxID=946362 RepID=F2TZF1_SALR5|nr:uncharacterized protein PTSG_01948 [Salpingoeca rosetta]EGD78975.1 hypothetical protein PTSG_01948 [Salpingoeca rosetta]|eukprot:XP_004997931.1 hypothetical protein PTSG_01948 [Salpingoeca rosetta]
MGCCGGGGSSVEPAGQPRATTPGPYKKRSCTDILFLALFLAFWAGMIGIAYVAYTEGDPERLISGTDSFGNVCGRNNSNQVINSTNSGLDMTNRSFVFFYNSGNSDALRLCVSACPEVTTDFSSSEYCVSEAPYTFLSADEGKVSDADFNIDASGCPTTDASSYVSVLSRCVAVDLSTFAASSYFQDGEVVSQVVDDLDQAWRPMLYLCLVAVFIALLMILLMSCFASILIWVTYVLSFVCCIGAIAYMWYRWHELDQAYNDTPVSQRLQSEKDNVNFYFNGGIVVSIVCGIILLILLVLRSRLALLVALFKEAGRAIRKMPAMLLFPFSTFVIVMLDIAYFVGVYVFLYTAGTAEATAIGHVSYKSNNTLVYMQWYHVFGFLWAVQLAFAIQEFTLAGAVSRWYFSSNKSDLGWPIFASLKNAFRYHLGSLALGAMIIALVQLARIILAYVQAKLQGRSGPVVDILLKCCSCCLWCMEKVLKYINRNAYIEIAIYGYSFCKGAREAFSTLLRNALRVATINSVGSFVLLLSKLVVVASVGFGSLYWFEQTLNLTYPAVPVFVVCIVAWIISTIFTGVYDMTIDTVFLCFAEDSERNDGSVSRPLYASTNLLKFMDSAKVAEQKKQRKQQTPTQAFSSGE